MILQQSWRDIEQVRLLLLRVGFIKTSDKVDLISEMIKIIQLKREPFRLLEVVIEGGQAFKKIYCKRAELVIRNAEICALQLRLYVNDSKLQSLKAPDLEGLLRNHDKISWISIDNIGIIEHLIRLLSQNTDWRMGQFSIELYFTENEKVMIYDASLFFQEQTLVMMVR